MKLKSYIVVKGDNLTKIANAHNLDVKDLIAANKNIKDPNLILVGQKLNVPETETLNLSTSQVQEAAAKKYQQLRSEKIKEGQMAAARQAEAERRNAGQISDATRQRMENKTSEMHNRQMESARQAEAERRNAGQVSPEAKSQLENRMKESNEMHNRQMESARQAEAERRNAGQVSPEAKAQLENRMKESNEIHNRQMESARQAEAERRNAGQVPEAARERHEVKTEQTVEQTKVETATAEATKAAETASQNIAAGLNKIPRIGDDGLIVLEKSQAGQDVINKLYREIPSHSNGTHSAQLDQMIDNLSAEECAWVLSRIEDKGFGQTGAKYAGKATPESHANFIQEQVIDRFGGDIHDLLKHWGTYKYSGY